MAQRVLTHLHPIDDRHIGADRPEVDRSAQQVVQRDVQDREMTNEKHDKVHSYVDINVNSDTLVLRGTGVDVTPALLSGNVVLYLTEPTSIKEITLQFRGKARIPPSASES